MIWTEQQRHAIYDRGESTIVSAAAGSGKTLVLANRVADFIIKGGSCRRLLVVTFTRLAAREMKDRIISVLDSVESPSEHIREQKLLLHSARISTIDSFFGEIVRDNFKDLDISPDYGIIDSVEYNYIKLKAFETVVEDYRKTYKNGYEHLEKIFGGETTDNNLSDVVNDLYSFMQSIPFGEKWAERSVSRYDDPKFWTDTACEEIAFLLEDYINVYNEVLDAQPFSDADMIKVQNEYDTLNAFYEAASAKDWNGCCRAASFQMENSPKCSKKSYIQSKYSLFRNKLKDLLTNQMFLIDSDGVADDASYMKGAVRCLLSMVKDYGDFILGEMKKKNAFSFDAVSKMALSLTVSDYDSYTGNFTKTPLAQRLSEEFDEILIDEYQDVNDLQDLFFSAISDNNCFCVGDIKQSIYRFRHANPKNFVRKRSEFLNIPLNRNYRSRSGILDFSNFVCAQLFSSKIGDTEYDETERLNAGAIYPDKEEADVEIKYLQYIKDDKDEKHVEEARFVAKEIKRLMASGMTVTDKKGERPVNFSDFAVLLRKSKGVSPIYERVFYEEDIPYFSKTGNSFLDSIEVNTVLAFLKAIDNPYDDEALFAVMFSRLYGFSADKIASLRTHTESGKKRGGKLYDALKELSPSDPELAAFYGDLRRFRLRSVGFPVHTLLWDIYTKTSYLTKILPLPLGNIKRDRLMSFYAFARKYGERTGGGTLSGFIDLAEKTIESSNSTEIESIPEGNFVRILTIHASKGLEFPVCIIPGLGAGLFSSNQTGIWLDEELGISSSRVSEGFEYRQPTMMQELMKFRERRTEMSEYLRVLYVGFTRAKEKLILVSKVGKTAREKFLTYALMAEKDALYRSFIYGASSFEALITAAVCRHKRASLLHSDFCDVLDNDFPLSVEIFEEAPAEEYFIAKSERKVPQLEIPEEELDRRFAPRGASLKLPVKVSVSELSDDSDAARMYPEEISFKEPLFISGKPLLGAGKGSAVHRYMQLCQLGKGVYSEAKRLYDEGLLTSDQYNAVISESFRIERFENSGLYAQMLTAKNVYREESFVSVIPARLYDPLADEKDEILIQGSIDMLCEFDDGLVIIDYKTDRATEEELKDRYSTQLKLYRMAVEKNFRKKVKSTLIWSFRQAKSIEIQ